MTQHVEIERKRFCQDRQDRLKPIGSMGPRTGYSSTSYTVDMSNGKCTCYMLLSTISVRVIQ
jgi:hypothetical protein